MNMATAVCKSAGLCLVSGLFWTSAALAQGSLSGGPGLGGQPSVLAGAAGTIASSAGGSLVWTHTSGTENWVGTNVAIGDNGAVVLSQFQGLHGATRLFHSQDANPPTPIWQQNAAYMSLSTRADAAKRADVQATLHFAQDSSAAPRVPVLAVYSSAGPMWSYAFPFTVNMTRNGVFVSSDGETIVAWVYDYSSLSTAVAVFSRSSATPRSFSNLATLGTPLAVKLSGDGSTLYVASAIKTLILDVDHGTVAYESYNSEGLSLGHAISGDGSIFARGLSQRTVSLYRKQGSTYAPWFTYDLNANAACMNLAISEDSSTLACGYNYGSPYLEVRTVVLDLTSPTHQVVMDESVVGSGALMNSMADLALSARGETVVVGLSGDELGAAPEVVVYAKDSAAGSWGRVYQFDLPGSVNDVDVSADGRRVAAASKAVHMSSAGSGGRIDVFELVPTTASGDLTWEGVPSIGSTLTFHHSGLTPGTSAELLVSPELALPPVEFPGVGTLYLKRDELTVEAFGTADQNGVFTCQVTIPTDDPTLAGRTYHVQSIGLNPAQLSHDWLTITIQP